MKKIRMLNFSFSQESSRNTFSFDLQATQPVQEYMNMPLDAQRAQHETARYLPQSLYILYVQASAYNEACDPHLEVKILGDLDVAKAAMEAKPAVRGLFSTWWLVVLSVYLKVIAQFYVESQVHVYFMFADIDSDSDQENTEGHRRVRVQYSV